MREPSGLTLSEGGGKALPTHFSGRDGYRRRGPNESLDKDSPSTKTNGLPGGRMSG